MSHALILLSTVPQWIQLAGMLIGVPVACILAWKAWTNRRQLWACVWWLARRRPVRATIVSAVFVVGTAGVGTGLYGGVVPLRQTQASDSTFLHSRHKSIACTDCHGTTNTHGGLKFSVPTGCLACHHSPQQRATCSTCHSAASLGRLTLPAANAGFQHSRHASIACTDCHGTTGTHGGFKFTVSTSGCMNCHHGPQQRAACSTCHAVQSIAEASVPTKFVISVRRDPVTRPLPFAHARHSAIACTRCHANDLKRSPTADCASCHADHHSAERDCASCHPTARAGHDRSAHAGCEHCHTDTRVAAIQTTRLVCLACHAAQRNHYPAGDCATCHALTNPSATRIGRTGSRQ
jgi:hypothetical protein